MTNLTWNRSGREPAQRVWIAINILFRNLIGSTDGEIMKPTETRLIRRLLNECVRCNGGSRTEQIVKYNNIIITSKFRERRFETSRSRRWFIFFSVSTKSSRPFRRVLLMLFIAWYTRVHNNRLDAYAGEVITIGIRRNTSPTTLGDSYSGGARLASANYSSVVFYFRYPQKPRV